MSATIEYRLRPAPEVAPGVLEPLAGRQPGLDHSLAFEVVDRQLRLLAKASGILNLYLGRALGPMLDRAYQKVGYARAQDYCIERLGFCRRTAELLRKQAVQIDRYPAVREAYIEGEINESATRLILDHLDWVGGDPAGLIAQGATCTVRALREHLAALAGAGAAGVGGNDGAEAAGERVPPAGEWRTYRLPPAWIATWEMVVEHFRRAEEADLAPWQVLELLAADFLAGRPIDQPAPDPRPPAPGREEVKTGIDARFDRRSPGRPVDWRRMMEEVSHCWKGLPEPLRVLIAVDGELRMPVPDDVCALDALLTDLVLCRRRLDLYLGRMLRTMADYGLARKAQFASIWHYAAERPGLGSSTVSRLIGRDRRLIRRQKVFAAIEAGRIGLTQADLIASLPEIAPDEKWIAWAEGRTCRALEDAVSDMRTAARVDPVALSRRGWQPPGEGEVLLTASGPIALGGARTCRGDDSGAGDGAGADDGAVAGGGAVAGDRAGAGGDQAGAGRDRAGAGRDGAGTGGGAGAGGGAVVGAEVSAAPLEAAHSSSVALSEAVKRFSMFSLARETLRIFVPEDVLPIVEQAEELASQMAGKPLPPEATLVALMIGAEALYSEFERKKVAQRRRLLRAFRYRCGFPGCRVRRGLHAHHVVFRSHGGGDGDDNRIMLCGFHHLQGVHGGWLRIRRAGGEFVFDVDIAGLRSAIVFAGERRVAGVSLRGVGSGAGRSG